MLLDNDIAILRLDDIIINKSLTFSQVRILKNVKSFTFEVE